MGDMLTDAAIRATMGMPLVNLAQNQIKKAVDGNRDIAREIITQAIVGIGQAINGEQIDAERLIYLAHVGDALQMILGNVPPKKALCLSPEGGAPKKDTYDRDLCLFFQVGIAYSVYIKSGTASQPVKAIQAQIARSLKSQGYKTSVATVKVAWEKCGALSNWKRIERDFLKS